MPIAAVNGVELRYETHGDPTHPALLLVMGYTAQLTSWPDGLVGHLVEAGHHVVRFDNRDAGLSTKSQGEPPDLLAVLAAVTDGTLDALAIPYTLSDMAADAVGLLDHLAIEKSHVVGASMGGMIAQHLAFEHPDRLLSATSIMSTTGDSEHGQADPTVIEALLAPPPDDFEEAVAHNVEVNRILAGPLWTRDEAVVRTRINMNRSFNPSGAAFQLAAIAASGDRTHRLASVDLPFLVIHGAQDRLIDASGGKATAEAVPGAELLMLDGMGHDLPAPLWTRMVQAIAGLTRNAG